MTRITIPKVEFYITNVCNLTCSQCNRYNDYNFTGWQKWDDYKEDYARWSEVVDIQQIVILGGEPLLNPSILDWIQGINKLWGKEVQVLTNGTRLNKVPGLYDLFRGIHNWIGISIHNKNDLDWYIAEVKKFLKPPIDIRVDKHTLDHNGGSVTYGADYWFCDSNGVRVAIWLQDSFYNVAVHRNSSGNLTLYNNNPEESHEYCGFNIFKNYHFIRGKLYKCGPVALFPEFDQQHHLDISEQDRELLNSYRPFTPDDFAERGAACLDEISKVIPQCKFCCKGSDTKQQTIVAVQKRKNATNSTNE